MRREADLSPQPVLLGLLMNKPQHGYELFQEFQRDLGGVWEIGLSQLYAHLKQLEEAALVTAESAQQSKRPPRTVYHLTAEGRQVFDRWVHQPTPHLRQIRVEFMARLYFFRRLSLPGLDQLVTEQKAVCRAQMEHFEELAAATADPFRRLVFEFRHGQLEAVLHWLDRCQRLQDR